MGIGEALFGNGPAPADADADDFDIVAYTVCYRKLSGNSGWSPVEGYERMERPITKDDFEYNEAPLAAGRYRLFALDENERRRQPPKEHGWKHKEPDPDAEPATTTADPDPDPERIAERAAEKAAARIREERGPQHDDPEVLKARLQANVMERALANPEFMARHGEEVALAAFDAHRDDGNEDGPGYDEWSDDPVGATFYNLTQTMTKEPEKVEDMGKAMGSGAGAFLDGLAAGAQGDGGFGAADAGADAGELADGWQPSDVDAGPSTMDDLGADAAGAEADAVGDELADLVVAQRRAERRAAGEAPKGAAGTENPDDATDAAPEARSGSRKAEPPGDSGRSEPREPSDRGDSHDSGDGDATTVRDDERRGMTAGPSQATEAEIAAESEVAASPDVVERAAGDDADGDAPDGLDPDRCRHVKTDGEQCGNPPEPDGDYCWVDGHGPADDGDGAATEAAAADGGDGPDPEQIAGEL